MPVTKRKTVGSIIRDRLGDRLNGLFVVARNPVSGESYDPFGLFALVDMDREKAYEVGGELSTELLEEGFEVPIKVEPGTEVSLPPSEVIEI